MDKSFDRDSVWVERILESIAGIQFGAVQIVIHNGDIIQIERTERRRFEPSRPIGDSERSKKKLNQ